MWFEGIDQLVKIAKVDWRALGLNELDRTEYGRLGQEQLFGYQRHYYEWAMRKRVPCLEYAWEWLAANKPDDDHLVGLSWGDSRLGNLMFDADFNVLAVFDWEMVRIANPEYDFAWYLWFDHHFTDVVGLPKVPGFASDDESIAYWEQQMGRKAEHLEWYTVLTMAYFAAIMARVMISNMAHGGDVESMAPMETNNTVTQALAKHFGMDPPEVIPKSPSDRTPRPPGSLINPLTKVCDVRALRQETISATSRPSRRRPRQDHARRRHALADRRVLRNQDVNGACHGLEWTSSARRASPSSPRTRRSRGPTRPARRSN